MTDATSDLQPARVLYWPGLKRNPSELEHLWPLLKSAGVTLRWLEPDYDVGPAPGEPDSPVIQWLGQQSMYSWWIGLSLGASVAHISAATVAPIRRPRRLTLINPIADRIALSCRNGFSLEQQWRIIPQTIEVPGIVVVDIVVSKFDERVPPEHGRSMLSCYPDSRVRFIELESGHTVDEFSVQRNLSALLLRDVPIW